MSQSARINAEAPSLSHLQALVAEDLKRVDAVILEKAQSDIPLIPQLTRHIIAAGGKRLRPALTLLSARLCGYKGDRHVRLAAAVEFIHTATLLHDDVVDESKLRRGTPTANDVWGNKASVLVGDFLLSKAFQLMVADGSLRVLQILSDASAVIAQGEVMQMSAEGVPETSKEDYLRIIAAKTAELFAAACEIGPEIAGEKQWVAPLREFGEKLGIAFQLVDDALDYSATSASFGKDVGDDFREGKITLPVIVAFQQGSAQEKTFWKRVLEDQQQEESDLATAMEYIKRHNGIGATLELARQYCAECLELLAPFPASPEKDALIETVDFCVKRAY